MARVRFISDFDFKPTKRVTVAYTAGMEVTVKRKCADQAIAVGKAKEIFHLKRGQGPQQHVEHPDEGQGKVSEP